MVTHTTQRTECKRIRTTEGKYLCSNFPILATVCGLYSICTFSTINLLLLYHACSYKFFHSDLPYHWYRILHDITKIYILTNYYTASGINLSAFLFDLLNLGLDSGVSLLPFESAINIVSLWVHHLLQRNSTSTKKLVGKPNKNGTTFSRTTYERDFTFSHPIIFTFQFSESQLQVHFKTFSSPLVGLRTHIKNHAVNKAIEILLCIR